MIAGKYPSQRELLEIFDYDDGVLIWKNPSRKKCYTGKPVGDVDPKGQYIRVRLKRKTLLVHRIIYIMHYGYIDEHIQIDHINNNRKDNRIENLRPCSNMQNQWNRRKSKMKTNDCPKGVYPHKNKFRAKITKNKKEIHLGLFWTIKDAERAYNNAAKEIQGEFMHKSLKDSG